MTMPREDTRPVKILIQLNNRSKSMLELSDKLFKGKEYEWLGDDNDSQPGPKDVEKVMEDWLMHISEWIGEIPMNDLFISTINQEGNIIEAL